MILALLALATSLSSTEPNLLDLRSPAATEAILRIAVDGGSADDPQGREGVAWLTAQVLAAGMRDSLGQPHEGTRIEVRVGRDMTVFTGRTSPSGGAAMHAAMARAILSPEFRAATIESQRAAQVAALDSLRADPARLAAAALDEAVDRGLPYAHPVEGRAGGIRAIVADDLEAFHSARYLKGGVLIEAAGAVDDSLMARIRKDYAALPDGAPDRNVRRAAWLSRPRFFVVVKPAAEKAWIAIGHPLPLSRAHPDYAPLRVAAADLGPGTLVPDLVALRGLSPGVAVTLDPEAGGPTARERLTLSIAFETAPVNARFAIDVALGDIERLAARGIPGERLTGAEDRVEAPSPLDAAPADLLLGNPGGSRRLPAAVRAVTAGDALSCVGRWLHSDRVAVVAVVPDAEAFIAAMIEPVAPVTYPSGMESAALDEADRAVRAVRRGLRRADFEVFEASDLFD